MSATDILGKIGEKVGTEIKTVKDSLNTHTSDQANPHNVSAGQIGLGNVENTALSTFAGSANITTLGTIASGAVPYNLVTGAPNPNQIDGDLNITGNLQVNGTRTILQTQTLQVEDNIIEINLASDGSETAQTAGIEINRGESQQSIVSNYSYGTFTWDGTETEDFGTGNTPKAVYRNTATSGYNSTLRIVYSSTAHSGDGYSQNGWFLVSDANAIEDQVTVGNDDLSTSSNFTLQGGTEDKAKIIWDDTTSKFRLKVGSAASDLVVDKIYNNNMFAAIGDLPSATQYHGMMAHVHATGQSYFAHGGNWVELISVSGGQTIAGTIAATSFLAPDKDGVKINNVSLGDYATFESALNTAMA